MMSMSNKQAISNEIATNIAHLDSSRKPEKSDNFEELLKFAESRQLTTFCKQPNVFYNFYVLAHACKSMQPVTTSSEVKFTPHVAGALQHILGGNEPYAMQTLAWNHLLRNDSLILINVAGSGRTLCYLPAICTLVEQELKLQIHGPGPLALVLVVSTLHAKQVHQHARKLLQSDCSIVAAHADMDNAKVCVQLEAGCSMLVATLPQIELLLAQNRTEKTLFAGNRLLHIVIDDVDMMNAFNPYKLSSMLVKLFQLSKMQSIEHQIRQQIVVTSKSWESLLTPMLLRNVKQPMLLFGDFLEAVFYGCYNLEVKVTAHGPSKLKILIETIKLRSSSQQRTVIVCKSVNDVLTVQVAVDTAGFACFACLRDWDSMMQADIEYWSNLKTPPLLICTDEQIQLLQVFNAHNLIHFTLPNCWPKFKQRHSVLVASYHNWIASQCPKSFSNALYVLVLFEYECIDEELPLLVEFLIGHKVHIDPQLAVLAKYFQQQLGNTKNKLSKYYIQSNLECKRLINYFKIFTSIDNVSNPTREELKLSNDSGSDTDHNDIYESACSDLE